MLPTITPSLLPTSWDLRWWVFLKPAKHSGATRGPGRRVLYSLSSGYKTRVLGDIVECGLGARHDADAPAVTSGLLHDVSVSVHSPSWGNGGIRGYIT